jgi:hypothetical protein
VRNGQLTELKAISTVPENHGMCDPRNVEQLPLLMSAWSSFVAVPRAQQGWELQLYQLFLKWHSFTSLIQPLTSFLGRKEVLSTTEFQLHLIGAKGPPMHVKSSPFMMHIIFRRDLLIRSPNHSKSSAQPNYNPSDLLYRSKMAP